MSKTKLGSNATFTGPQKGLTTIGDYCYAYSGEVTSEAGASAHQTLLEFSTGKGIVKGTLSSQTDETGGATEYFDVEFNGMKIVSAAWDNSASSQWLLDFPLPLIIPPNTHVKVLGGASNQDIWTVQFVGRIYG